jgi:cell division protease FtsH
MTLGGRSAEVIVFGKISTGALSDLERVTKMAYSMVTIYGMNDKIGNVSFYDSKQSDYNFTKPYSESTAQTIDQEVKKIIDSAFERTMGLLKDKRKELEIIANELLQKEIIFQTDLERLIGKRPFSTSTTYEAFTRSDEKIKPDDTLLNGTESEDNSKNESESNPAQSKEQNPTEEIEKGSEK